MGFRICILSISLLLFFSCIDKKKKADTLYINGTVYTVDSSFSIQEAFVTKNGHFLEVGHTKDLIAKYEADTIVDLEKRPVFPGFYDAHCHFLGYGLSLNQVNLNGTKSYNEVIERVVKFAKENPNLKWILGRGWDQNDWEIKNFPSNDTLNKLFPELPVVLRRVDGHALLANKKAINIAKIKANDPVDGIELNERGDFSGIFIDNAAEVILNKKPLDSTSDKIAALLKAQKNCLQVGLTTVDDAGLPLEDVLLIDKTQKAGDLHINVYAMLEPNPDCFEFAKDGYYQTEKLNVRAFKVYADGALGSRGACLKQEYSDKKEHKGFLVTAKDSLVTLAKKISNLGYQMNTHCIGDSANKTLLHIYAKELKGMNDKRWRIEHAQVIDSTDFELFKNYAIIPSVQPTHCTSDMYWAEDRIGQERIKFAYAYKTLLKQNGLVAAGSDFPIESINPLFGFYAAISRKDHHNFPDDGFYSEEGLSREEALKAMTIWAAFSNFEEKEKGSISTGKRADFVILEKDIMQIELPEIIDTKVYRTFIGDKAVYSAAKE